MATKKIVSLLMSAMLLAGLGGTAFASEGTTNVQKQIASVQREYFALYNKLNSDPLFDIVCRGRLADGRTCWPRYLEAEWLLGRNCVNGCETYAGPAVPALTAANERGFRRNAAAVFLRSPELQALGVKLEQLQGRQRTATN